MPPRLLELFSGTGSVGDCFRMHGWEVVSLDSDPSFSPTICADILTFDYTKLGGTFLFVWASPPCTQYSIARSKAKTPRDLEGADACVRRCLDIISYFKPLAFCIENPQSGLLKTREVVNGLPYVDFDYCSYGFPYRKRTRIWTNLEVSPPPLCNQNCGACEGGRHREWAQKASKRRGEAGFKTRELGRIPRLLVEDIFASVTMALGSNR